MKFRFAQIQFVKKILSISFLALVFLTGINTQVEAQRDRGQRTDDYFDESGVGSFRFWYGGGVGLNFGSNAGSSQFSFSLSPMAGYKITPELSVGPRAELAFTHFRFNTGNNVERQNFLDYGIGVFARYKIFSQFFLHTEYQWENEVVTFNGDREADTNFFIGGGYSSGGQIGYEISILWNTLEDSAELPLDYRVAFTYNF